MFSLIVFLMTIAGVSACVLFLIIMVIKAEIEKKREEESWKSSKDS